MGKVPFTQNRRKERKEPKELQSTYRIALWQYRRKVVMWDPVNPLPLLFLLFYFIVLSVWHNLGFIYLVSIIFMGFSLFYQCEWVCFYLYGFQEINSHVHDLLSRVHYVWMRYWHYVVQSSFYFYVRPNCFNNWHASGIHIYLNYVKDACIFSVRIVYILHFNHISSETYSP